MKGGSIQIAFMPWMERLFTCSPLVIQEAPFTVAKVISLFAHSNLHRAMDRSHPNVPPLPSLPNINIMMPHMLFGDDASSLHLEPHLHRELLAEANILMKEYFVSIQGQVSWQDNYI